MGGKNKQAQRTKNNARPSSSGRSAEMLAATIPHFATFQAAKDSNFTLPGFSLAGLDEMDSSVDSNFQLVLRKMNKKDSTTKLKALQEFSDLIKSSDPEAVTAVLAFWPRIYNTLATDAEHRVREASHDAHYEVVVKAKRNLAPFLKQLIGPWFTSQYDTYPPAASAATKAFEAAFPSNKIQDAILFCQDEILSYISENLVSHSPHTLSNPKTTSTEDADAKYERVIISSLQGYSLYLNKLNTDAIKKASDLNKKIITNSKFWKLANHNVAKIRSAWFGVLQPLYQKASFLLEKEEEHICACIFGNLDESEPAVLVSVWEAALLTVTTIENWWKFISIEKVFLPKLWKVLKDGGQGNASIIYPNLLPLISHLSPQLDVGDFYNKFFDNLRAGLKNKNVLSSRSEVNAVLTAIMECLQFIILTHQNDMTLCEKLIRTQLFPLLEWCFSESQSPHKNTFNQVAAMIQYWSRNYNNSEIPNYSRYLDFFWKSLSSMFKGLFMNLEQSYEDELLHNFATKNIDLLLCLKHNAKVKKQQKVKFSHEPNENIVSKTNDDDNKETLLSESYQNNLHNLVFDICQLYIDFINNRQSKILLNYLKSIIQDFESEDFFLFLNQKLFDQTETKDLIGIYHNLLSKWLKSSNLLSQSVIDLIFLLFKYLNKDGKELILNELANLNKENFRWSISHMLSVPYKEDENVQKWLCEELVGKHFVNIVEEVLNDTCSPESILLLKKAFTEMNNGEFLISKATILNIIKTFCRALSSPDDYLYTIDTCASLAAYISEMIYSESLNLTYGDDLILAFFTFSCNNKLSKCDYLSEDTLWEVNTSWQDAIFIISSTMDNDTIRSLTRKFTDIVEKKVLENHEFHYAHLVDVIINFIRCIQKSKPLLVNELLLKFFNRSFALEWKEKLVSLAINSEYIRGTLSCQENLFIKDNNGDIEENHIIKYFLWTRLIINVISTPIEELVEDSLEEECDEIVSFIEMIDKPEILVLNAIYDICILYALENDYTNTNFYKFSQSNIEEIKLKIKSIFKSCSEELKYKVMLAAIQKHDAEKWIWSHVLYLICSELILIDNLCDSYQRLNIKLTNDLAKLQLLQTFANDLTFKDIYVNESIMEHIIILRSLINCDEIQVQIREVCEKIYENSEIKQYFQNINFSNWYNVQLVIEVMRLCASIISKKPQYILPKFWDFSVIALSAWSVIMKQMKNNYKSIQIAAFMAAISELFCAVTTQINLLKESSSTNDQVDEWDNIFAAKMHTIILNVWFYLTDEYQTKNALVPFIQVPMLKLFGYCISNINTNYLFKNALETTPNWSKILKRCCLLMLHKDTTMQMWGYFMLLKMIPGLIEVDSLSVQTNTPHAKGLILEKFKSLLVQTHEIVQTMLIDFKLFENSCRVEAFTDSYTYTFAYLLVWDIILTLCENSSTELCYQYADWLKKEEFLTNLLNNIFKLMPVEVLHNTDSKSKLFEEYFTKKFKLSLKEETTSEKLEQMACWIYASTVYQLPASVRQWWSATDTKTAQIVERVTSVFVSPQLSLQELQDVSKHENKFKNMVVKVHPTVREVVAIYTVDEAQMELILTLPLNYPLGSPDVQCNRQIGGTSHKQWLMQLKKCVLHQNGRIWDGLSLWNNNLDKKFDGVEECYICFAILHPGTYQLPKLSCQTCRKKFHSACLYKWFSTSNKSTCPICRNLF